MTFLKSGQANSAKSLKVKAEGSSLVFHFKSVLYMYGLIHAVVNLCFVFNVAVFAWI